MARVGHMTVVDWLPAYWLRVNCSSGRQYSDELLPKYITGFSATCFYSSRPEKDAYNSLVFSYEYDV